jgi:hypothetical protein
MKRKKSEDEDSSVLEKEQRLEDAATRMSSSVVVGVM